MFCTVYILPFALYFTQANKAAAQKRGMYYTVMFSVCAVFIQAVLLCCRGANVNVAFITIYAIIYVCTC